MSVVVVGLPASGKTTVGALVAEKLGVPFVDTDAVIEERAGKLIREIFADEGEAHFRALEAQVVAEALAPGQPGVVSLGGGAIMHPEIQNLVRDHQVVWLDVTVVTLTRRAGLNRLRPLLLGDLRSQMTLLADRRLPVLERVATFRVNGERPVDEIVAEVVDQVSGVTQIPVTGERAYDVVVGHGVITKLPTVLGRLAGPVTTAIIHPPVLAGVAARLAEFVPSPHLIEVLQGEAAKTPAQLDRCWRALAEAGLTRSDVVIGLGGGATTDLAGFVAATYLRGVAYVAVPTTVLGMADAAVGGKTGINLPAGKNLVGAFYDPVAVLADLDLLAGLPSPEVRSGLAEIVKCGFIADPVILDLAASPAVADTRSAPFADALARAVSVKARAVTTDFREQATGGVGRAALNYGHTLGHAIEKAEGYEWAHGDAVAVGMVYAAEVARRLGLIGTDLVDQHRRVLGTLGLPVAYAGVPWADLRATMALDKKARGTSLRMVLLEGLGQVKVVADLDEARLAEAYAAIGS